MFSSENLKNALVLMASALRGVYTFPTIAIVYDNDSNYLY